ncbi:MAG TPA: nitroreductase family deazaflavin-dependent oxidoreductase [Pseudomonadales bacterium]|nr:nitroreductase family deazaflavin-dependent oxidoreductase [Pseudomonadales bacterium]
MANPLLKMLASLNAAVYKATDGKWMGKMGKSDICVVRMQGARSGRWRDVPLMYVPNGDGVILVASLGGAPKNPVWYHNLIAHPDIEVIVRDKTLKLRARLASAEEKAVAWPRCVAAYPAYADYQKRTTRDIPVFICDPR